MKSGGNIFTTKQGSPPKHLKFTLKLAKVEVVKMVEILPTLLNKFSRRLLLSKPAMELVGLLPDTS